VIYTIAKRFTFAASHQLDALPDGHPCGRLHGHNYAVTLMLRNGDLDPAGMLVDSRELEAFRAYLDGELDHRHLNDVLPADNPTAEHVARHLFGIAEHLWAGKVFMVRVYETETSWAQVQR
jgi:6-pyruvoyltetrahydropterin/6-carboxytetrahydropterin synthase